MQIFMSLYEWQLKKQLLYTANFLHGFNLLKMAVCINFPNFDDPNDFTPKCNKPLALTSENKKKIPVPNAIRDNYTECKNCNIWFTQPAFLVAAL